MGWDSAIDSIDGSKLVLRGGSHIWRTGAPEVAQLMLAMYFLLRRCHISGHPGPLRAAGQGWYRLVCFPNLIMTPSSSPA